MNQYKDYRQFSIFSQILEFQQASLISIKTPNAYKSANNFYRFTGYRFSEIRRIADFFYQNVILERWVLIIMAVQFLILINEIILPEIGIYITCIAFYIISKLIRLCYTNRISKSKNKVKIFKKLKKNAVTFSQYIVNSFSNLLNKSQNQLKQQESNNSNLELLEIIDSSQLKIGDIIIIERDQTAPLDLLILDVSQEKAAIDYQNIQEKQIQQLIPPTLTNLSRKIQNREKLNTEYRKMLTGFIKIQKVNEKAYKGFIKLKKDPKGEELTNSSFMIEGSKFKYSEWGIGIVINKKQKIEQFEKIFKKSKILYKTNRLVLIIFLVQLTILFFFAILYQRNYGNNLNFILNITSIFIHLNFYLLNIYTLHDLFNIFHTLKKMYFTKDQLDLRVEDQNNAQIKANKILISPQLLNSMKFSAITSIYTQTDNISITQKMYKQMFNYLLEYIQSKPLGLSQYSKNQSISQQDIKAQIYSEDSIKYQNQNFDLSDQDNLMDDELLQLNNGLKIQSTQYFYLLIQSMLLTTNTESKINRDGKLQKLNLFAIEEPIRKFLNEIKCQNFLKYQLQSVTNKIICIKICNKIFKFELIKSKFQNFKSVIYVKDLQNNIKQSTLLFIREEVENFPDYYFMNSENRQRVKKIIRNIVKKGEIPVIFGMKKLENSKLIDEGNENITFCGIVSVTNKINPESLKLLQVLQRKQIQPIFVSELPLFQISGTLSKLKIFKKKIVFNLREGDIVSLKIQMLKFLKKFEKKNYDLNLKSSAYQIDYQQTTWKKQIIFMFSGKSLSIIQEAKNQAEKYFLCLLNFSYKVIVHDMNPSQKKKFLNLIKKNPDENVLAIINKKSDMESYQEADYLISTKKDIRYNMNCQNLSGLIEAIEEFTYSNIVPYKRSITIYLHIWISCFIYVIIYSLWLMNSISSLILNQFFMDMFIYNAQYICFIILGLLFKWKVEKINTFTAILYAIIYVIIYGTSFHSVYVGILFFHFFLPIFVFKKFIGVVISLIVNIIIEIIYIILSKQTINQYLMTVVYTFCSILTISLLIRYIYQIYVMDLKDKKVRYSIQLFEQKQNEIVQDVDSIKKMNLREQIKQFFKTNGYDLAIAEIFNLNFSIDSIPLRFQKFFLRFLKNDVENQYLYYKSKKQLTLIFFQYLASLLSMQIYFIVFSSNNMIVSIGFVVQLYCLTYFYLSKYQKIWIYMFYILKLVIKIYIDATSSSAYVISILFFILTMRDYIIRNQFKMCMNILQILCLLIKGFNINNVMIVVTILVFYAAMSLYFNYYQKLERARFSYDLCFNNESKLYNQLLKIMLPQVVQKFKNEKYQIFYEKKVIFCCNIYNFNQILVEQREYAVRIIDKFWKTLDSLITQNNMEKVQTVGKKYLAVANKLNDAVILAYQLINFSEQLNIYNLDVKISINYGPVQGIVIGVNRPQLIYVGKAITQCLKISNYGKSREILLCENAYNELKKDFQNYSFCEQKKQTEKFIINYYILKLKRNNKIDSNIIRIPNQLENNLKTTPKEKYIEIKLIQQIASIMKIPQIKRQIKFPTMLNQEENIINISEYYQINYVIVFICIAINIFWLTIILFSQQLYYELNIICIIRFVIIVFTVLFIFMFIKPNQNKISSNIVIRVTFQILIIFLSVLESLVIQTGLASPFLIDISNIMLIISTFNIFFYTEENRRLIFILLLSVIMIYIPVLSNNSTDFRFFFYLIVEILLFVILTPEIKNFKESFVIYFNQQKKKRLQLTKITQHLLPPHILNLFISFPNKKFQLTQTLENVTIILINFVGLDFFYQQSNSFQNASALRKMTQQLDNLCKNIGIFKLYSFNTDYMAFGLIDIGNRSPQLQARNVVEVGLNVFQVVQKIKNFYKISKEFNVKIAVNTGTVYGGLVGADIVKYDIFGESVKITYQIAEKCAVGKLLVTAETYQKLQGTDSYKFDECNNFKLRKSSGDIVKSYYLSRM